MRIQINAKQLHKRKQNVASYSYELPSVPANLRNLLEIMVLDGVKDYNRRIRSREDGKALSAEELEEMSRVGKIGFGIPFGSREADPAAAVETAIRGFEDGLYRFFVGDTEIGNLDAPLKLHDGDTITIIRLTMLTGGFFW